MCTKDLLSLIERTGAFEDGKEIAKDAVLSSPALEGAR